MGLMVAMMLLMTFPVKAQEPEDNSGFEELILDMDTSSLDDINLDPQFQFTQGDSPLESKPFYPDHVWDKLDISRSICALEVLKTGDLLAMACTGRIYRMSRMGRWSVAFGASFDADEFDPEQLLLDAESTIEELNTDDSEEVYDEDGEELVELLPDDVAEEVEQSIFDPIRDRVRGGEESIRPPRSIHEDTNSGAIFACRDDGCYRSPDGGYNWYPLNELPVSREFVRFGDTIFAASEQGVWWSKNGGRDWFEADSGMQNIQVRSIDGSDEILLAATSEGVFMSLDGVRWGKTIPPRYADLAAEDICVDNLTNGGLWIATKEGILRSDDLMQSVYPLGKNPLSGTRELYQWTDNNNHLFSVGADGVWESIDGGMRWYPIYEGLSSGQIFDIEIWKGAPVIATTEGVYYLVPGKTGDWNQVFSSIELPPLNVILDSALTELDGQLSSIEIQRRFLNSRRVPQLNLTGEYGHDRAIGADYGAIRSTATNAEQWQFTIAACFGACSSSTSSTAFVGMADDLMVVDGEVYESGDSGVLPAAANVLSNIITYRQDVSGSVIDLYTTYQRLILQSDEIAGLSLFEQSLHQLEMDEVLSRLDALTDGTFYQTLTQQKKELP